MPSADKFVEMMNDLDGMDDRASALILSALIDIFLKMAIELQFVSLAESYKNDLFRSANAPLSSFAAKTVVAHALGIFDDETKRQIDRIRTIRNAFAHSVLPIGFDEPLVEGECQKLDPQALSTATWVPSTGSAKERFLSAGQMIAVLLIKHIRRAGQVNATMGRRQVSSDKFVPVVRPQPESGS